MLATVSFISLSLLTQAKEPIVLQIDATDVGRNLIRVKEDIPASSGPFVIRFPKWIPGEHAPSGPLRNAIRLHVFANGKEIAWVRDGVDLYDIHLDVPQGAKSVHVEFVDAESTNDVATSVLARLKFNRMMFLPKGPVETMPIRATVKVPAGWKAFDSLAFTRTGDTLQFAETNVERLIDSPAMIGKYGESYPVSPGHELCVVGDEPKNIVPHADTLAGMKRIVDETLSLYGAKHYNSYKWLVSVSNFGGWEGLEHNECSEDGMGADAIMNSLMNSGAAGLLSHEFNHSWCGKYRRAADLYQPDYATPQRGSMMWVYEGMDQYWGYVLPARAGLWNADQFHDVVAADAARLAIKGGRNWRSTEDTSISASIIRHPPPPWSGEVRGQDYYQEGVLMWIGADATIRRLTNGQKSIDDFCKLFYGGSNTGPKIVPYKYEDVIRTLNQVVAHDWDGYIQKMVYAVHPGPTTEGLEMAGWRLIYNDQRGGAGGSHIYDMGIEIGDDGSITDMNLETPAEKAGLAPGMKVLTVGTKPFSADAFNDAIVAGMKPGNPIVLQVTKDNIVSTITVNYSGGLRFPHLERIENSTDYLTQSCVPTAKPAGK